jgi:dihydropyrimidine dehydrogenase (NAD+) subunit PreT
MYRVAPKRSSEDYERSFADINPPFTPSQAAIAAARCLYCYDAPCVKACPTRIDVPSFIRKISTGNLKGSARVILESNILGESCGRVCPTEVLCEGACVLNESQARPVEIGRLQRHAVDYVLDNGIRLFEAGTANGRRVACVGSGPASLACAAELAKRGYEVVVYDRESLPGGLNTYGIAAYKMRAFDSLREARCVEELGVKFRQGVEVGKDISFAELESYYHAIFLGLGLGETWAVDLPGEELEGVFGALEFIRKTKTSPFASVNVGRRVAVIGAGNTAIDAVTAARRLGAEFVCLIYRRDESSMPAFRYEYDLAKKDGVVFYWQTLPLRILGENGTVRKLECVRSRLQLREGLHPNGRTARVEPVASSEFLIEVDMVIKALGQQPATDVLRSVPNLKLKAGRVVVNAETHQTDDPKYFAGGDCVNGGKEVVDAVAEGMAAARGIHAWLEAG